VTVLDQFASGLGVEPGSAFVLGNSECSELQECAFLSDVEVPETVCHDCGDPTYLEDGFFDHYEEAIVCHSCSVECDGCNEYFLDSSLVHFRRFRLCRPGCEGEFFCCDECGDLTAFSNDYQTMGDSVYCSSCSASLLRWCDDCSETCWAEDVCSDCGVCERCEHSEGCGGYEGGPNAVGVLYPYDYSPDEFSFFGHGPLFVGLELELEVKGDEMDRKNVVRFLSDRFGERAYLKRDGSLVNGVEIVTHPMSPAAFSGWGDFDRTLKDLPALDCVSWNSHRCGFHVHVSRAAFANPRHVFAFALFFYRNRQQIAAISGRRDNELEKWASLSAHQGEPHSPWGGSGPRLLDKVRGVNPGARYSAVNMCNPHTLEVRVFRGSLRPETVRGYVQLVAGVVKYAAGLSSAAIRSGALEWSAFRASLDPVECAHLLDLCDRRGV